MEVVGLVQEMLQNVAEYAVSYRLGQSMLRHMDRVLWTVEKCARWAVPPPLDQDDHPQPELIRPLPWVFFLMLLLVLRVTRESISLINLVLGKPPLRSADVVTYIQGKRRYLRTLKYQGNRMMRARSTPAQPTQTWFSGMQSLFEFTMCFRRHTHNYGNNNTTRVSNNDEVLIVKRNKHGRQEASPVASTSETTMERLIEKMMVDLQADSDDDSSFTLTNPMSAKSDRSEGDVDSEQDVILQNDNPNKLNNQHNDSCQPDTSKPETMIDNFNHKHGKPQTDEVRREENAATKAETMSSENEIFRLLQSERNFSQNNKHQLSMQKSTLTNGKAAKNSPSIGKESLTNSLHT